MTTSTRIERELPGILGDLSAGSAPDYLDDVFGRTARMRQRPAWTFPERWLPMSDIARYRAAAPAPPWRIIAIALVVIALGLAALVAIAASQRRVPAPPFGPAANGLIPYDIGGEIYVGDPVTGESRLVVGGPEYDTEPGFSPDGTRLAFIRSMGNTDVDLYTVREDGTDLRRVSQATLADIYWSTWTPDSQYLLVGHEFAGSDRFELLDVTGQQPPKELAAGYRPDNVVFRPPDGREILFRAVVDGKLGLFVMNADGTGIRPLISPTMDETMDQHLNAVTYTADGARILYQHAAEATAGTDGGCCELWVMNADGTDPHRFDPLAGPGQAGIPGTSWGGAAVVSPDGQWVAYWHTFNDRPTQRVSVMRADGTGTANQVGPELDDTASWVWSPDSTKILLSPHGARRAVYLVDPTDGSFTTAPWQSASGPDWQRRSP